MQRGRERTATSLLNHSRSFSISGLAICIQGVASCIIGISLCCVQHLGVPCIYSSHPGLGTRCMLRTIQGLLSLRRALQRSAPTCEPCLDAAL